MIFIINFAFIFLYMLLSVKEKKYTLVLIILTGIQLILLLSMRGLSVGIDTYAYYNRFNTISELSFTGLSNYRQEYGFSLMTKYISLLTDNYNVFLFICAIAIIMPVIITAYKYSENPLMSIVTYISFNFYAGSFNATRQYMAYGLTFLSYKYIKEKKFFMFLTLVLVAAQIHKSAYVFLPAYFLAQLKLDKYTYSIYFCLLVLSIVFKNNIYQFVESTMYNTVNGVYAAKPTGAYMWSIMVTLIFALTLLCYSSAHKLNEDYRAFTMFLGFGVILLVFSTIGSNVRRVTEYYCTYLIFLIPSLNLGISSVKIKGFVVAITLIILVGLFFWGYLTNSFKIIPYKFYFE